MRCITRPHKRNNFLKGLTFLSKEKGPLQSPVFLFAGTNEAVSPEIMDTAENMRKAGVRVGVLVGNHLFHIAPLYPIPVMDQYFEEITAFLYGKR